MEISNYVAAGISKRVFVLTGSLDSYSDLEAGFVNAFVGVTGIIIDLSQVSHVLLSGILFLVALRERCETQKKSLVLCGLSYAPKKYLLQVGILDHFTIVPDLDAALATA